MPAELRPIGGMGRIVVRRDPRPMHSDGGIAIPEPVRQAARSPAGRKACDERGTVVSTYRDCTAVSPGDRVLFWEMAGTDIEFGGETLTVMPESEIVAVIEQE